MLEIVILDDQISRSFNMIALITKLNKPSVKKINGEKIRFNMGFKKMLIIVNIAVSIRRFSGSLVI
ncbi:MAG: hypothetical protein M1155_00420 [Patescibacteria group bacterium]|nr:hypothetical protein [Patescibacteria group bacterium]